MQEFVTGMALCLHGSIRDKCQLRFKIFNLVRAVGIFFILAFNGYG